MLDDTIVWILWGVATLVGGFLVFVGLQFLGRGNPLERIRTLDGDEIPGAADQGFHRIVETLVNTELKPGNQVEILFDGDEVYPRLFEDLEAAGDLITWHVFWFKPGELADRLRDVLCERARAGVDVRFLYDRFGAMGVPGEYWQTLREAGVDVRCFRPLRWNRLYKWQQRSHTRTVAIDGRVGFTGGFAIHDDWLGDGRHPDQWRDTSVRLEGPIVHRLQAAFVAAWAEATGDLLLGDRLFPPDLPDDGPHRAGLLFNSPSIGSTDAERYFAISIEGARETLYVTNAYFVPDDDFRHLLRRAVERGVDVRILTPGPNTDRPSTWYAARCHYQEMLDAGVRIFEYDPTMVHAKTLVVDASWCSVGTMNFDNRSMSLNEEVTMLAQDEALGRRLHERFLDDLERATEIDPESFRRRGLAEKAQERFWVLFSRFL